MKNLTLEQHRARIENIRKAEQSNKKYYTRHRIHDYLSGQVIYNMGEYPAKFSMAPDEYDYNLLKGFADQGIGLVQIHEEWNDSIRRFGGHKYTCHDPEGFKKFIDLCHSLGLKIIAYASTGFLDERDPDFTEKFCRIESRLAQTYFNYRKCWLGSPEWRHYMLPLTQAILDTYELDGLYNDLGYDGERVARYEAIKRGSLDFTAPYDPDLEDALGAIYGEIKKRGGIYKLHRGHNDAPPVKDRVYDYLWIGESITNPVIGAGKEYLPYIVPCPDHGRAGVDASNAGELSYMKTIPFMQFPLLTHGRPRRGAGIDLPGVEYFSKTGVKSEYAYNARIREYAKTHPDGPHVLSGWSAVPPQEGEYEVWSKYYALYRPMVEENSVAYIELRECDEILSTIPEKLYASMFVNEETYLVASNFTGAPYELKLADTWTNRETNERSNSFIIPDKFILFLKK
ncbi:MAG: hypothetical protein E7624_00570 [Ruminococcaceae bacterium]|nr:hypothetical protein [Oscillospiraceae bacterium]